MPDSDSPPTTPDSNDVPDVRPEMTDDQIRDEFRRAYYHNKEDIGLFFNEDPDTPKTLDGLKGVMKDVFETNDEAFKARFDKLNQEVVDELAPKFMQHMDGPADPQTGQTTDPHQVDRSEPTPTSRNEAKGADPVILYNGEFVYSATDFQIGGAGIDFGFVRTYSQLVTFTGPLGSNWDHAYNLWLRVDDVNTIHRSTGTLREEMFKRHETFGYWVPPDGASGVLEESGASYTLRMPNGGKVIYQPHPTLQPFIHIVARIEDRFGNGLDFEYTDALLSRVVVNNPQRTVDFIYDTQDRIVEARDFSGRAWTYSYDDLGNLAAITTPATPDYKAGLTTFYEYSGPFTGDSDLAHNLTTIIDAGGHIYLENQYGTDAGLVSYRRVVRQRQGSGDVLFDYEDVVQDFEFEYADRERPVRQTIVTNRDGTQDRFLFNRFGNVIFREEYARLDGVPKLVSWHYRYNDDGNLIGSISPLGVITQALYERDLYQRRFPQDPGASPETDPNLTEAQRLQFDNLLATVKRGRYYNLSSLNQSLGLWSKDILPDIFQTDADDVIQKFSYEPEFSQSVTVSDPRVTRSVDPAFVEGSEYDRRLTNFSYSPGAGFEHFLLASIDLPAPTLPDGTASAPVKTRFPEYDARGRRTRTISPSGLEVVNAYSSSAEGAVEGLLKSTTLDPAGINLTRGIVRDQLGRAVRLLRAPYFDSPGDRFYSTFEYNALSQVVQSTSTAPFSIGCHYSYHRAGMPARLDLELKDENNDPAGTSVARNSYDEERNLIAQSIGDSAGQSIKQVKIVFDRAARPFLFISPGGRKRKTFFNERSLAVRTVDDYGGVHAVTQCFYDADGRPVRTIDPRGNSTRLSYDTLGRLVDAQDAQGNRDIRYFDKNGNVTVECRYQPAGDGDFLLLARREFTYDELGRLVIAGVNQFEQPPSVPAGQVLTAFQASGPGALLTLQCFYDAVGNLVKQVDSDGRTCVSEYDILGRVTRKLDPNGDEVSFQYDKEGNVLRGDRKEVTRDSVTNAVTSERYFAETFAYDELNRLVEHKTVTGVVQYRFDSRGNVVEVQDALGNTSRNTYDVFGRMVVNSQPFKRQPQDTSEPAVTSFTYDRDDQKISHTDALGRVTSFLYDTAGRLTSTILPDGSMDASTYDQAGNLTGYRDRNGLVRQVDWDELNRPTLLQVDATALTPGAEFAGATQYRTEYDGLGRFKQVENDFVVTGYTYNSLNQLLQETTSFTAVTGLDPAREFVVTRTFSNRGALTGLTYPSGREIRFGRDVLNRVVNVQQSARGSGYPGDPTTPDDFTIAQIGYQGLRLGNVSRGNGTSTAYQYDFTGRMIEMRHATATDPVLTLQFLHDALGNVRQRVEASADFQSTETFDYDSLSRLYGARRSESAAPADLSAIAPPAAAAPDPLPNRQAEIDGLLSGAASDHATTYEYDLSGNRTSKTLDAAIEHYATNERDEYIVVEGVNLRYDANGNLAEDDQFRYAYDHRNQLARIVRKADGHQLDVFLDYFGRSCIQRDQAASEITVYDGRNVLEQYSDGQLLRSVVSNTEQDGILASASGGSDLYLLADQAGSVRYVYDRMARRNFYVYDEFGALRQSLNPTQDENIFRFAGKRLLSGTDKYDFVFRTYDPARGRFLQRDPKGYADGSNLYVYGKNNPLLFRDPDGLESRPEQTVNTGLYAGRAVATPLDRSKVPLKGTYNLWSGKQGLAQAKAAPGWIMEQTREHEVAEALEKKFYANNPGQTMPRDTFEDIWVARSKTVARKAVLAGMPVAPWGLDTHPNPTGTVQYQHELPTVSSWGALSALTMKIGGLLNIWAAAHVDNPYVKTIGLGAGTAETFGGTLYLGGALTQDTAMMALGSTVARYAGGVGLVAVSGYNFVHDVARGNVRDAIGSGSNVVTGITMLATSNPIAIVATGTFAFSYNASRWVARETGWGERSGQAGAAVANAIMGDDPGVVRTVLGYTVGYTGGFIVTAGGVLVVEPAVFAGKKIGQAASWTYDKITDAIGYEFYWPF